MTVTQLKRREELSKRQRGRAATDEAWWYFDELYNRYSLASFQLEERLAKTVDYPESTLR